MEEKVSNRKSQIKKIWFWLSFVCFTLLLFLANEAVGFMRDDKWYATNLVTGEPLKNLRDIWEGQVWHFFHWGGRSVTHFILQTVILCGSVCADVINTLMTLGLGFLMYKMSEAKRPYWILGSLFLLIGVNYNVLVSMMWEAGCVNYVYSTVWIFFFVFLYLRELEGEEKKLPLANLWILPLGLMTGWSNENMGPAAFVMALGITVFRFLFEKKKPKIWMLEGILTSLLGSLLVILAPGNFERSALITYDSLWDKLHDRIYEMFHASFNFLFLGFFILLVSTCLYVGVYKQTLKKWQIAMFLMGVMAHGAFLLSPTYPDRATFGVLCICVLLSVSMLEKIYEYCEKKIWLHVAGGILLARVCYILLQIIIYAEVFYPKDAISGIL